MPSYRSHSIFGIDVNNTLKDEKFNQIEIDNDYVSTYALGPDLTFFDKKCNFLSHNKSTSSYLINFIKYIKDNKLYEDPEVMALLYGHISHYFLDTRLHPYIFYTEKGMSKVGPTSPHTFVEAYIDDYLEERIKLNRVSPYLLEKNIDKKLSVVIDDSYKKIYNKKDMSKIYKMTLKALKLVERIYKSKDKASIKKIVKFDKYLKENNLTLDDLTNECNNEWLYPVSGERSTESIMDLYSKAKNDCINAIIYVNEYLYGNIKLNRLKPIFVDLSYDTGEYCKKGRIFKYTRNCKIKG